jgi:hypothetical protein
MMAVATGAAMLAPRPALAQTTLDATTAEFAASADHSALSADGNPRVTSYRLEIFPAGSTTPAFSLQLGKPAPDGQGLIRVAFAPLLPAPLVGGTIYQARVSAVGPGGASASDLSNAFATSAPCAPLLSAVSASLAAAASTGAVTVSAGATCMWTAGANATWLQITSGASVTGAGVVTFAATANTSTTARSGTLTIAGQTVNVIQAGATSSCSYAINPASRTVAAAGETGTVAVTTSAGCAWTATSGVSWVTVTDGTGRSGNGTVTIQVAANSATTQRTGNVTIAGRPFAITQTGACAFTVTPASLSVADTTTSGTFTISTTAACTWSAAGMPSWITIATGTRTGSGTLSYAIAANPDAARSVTLTIAGKLIPVAQMAPPLPAPANFRIVKSGG